MIWKILTVALAVSCIVLLFMLAKNSSTPKLNDPRLLGTWVSDRERTLESLGPSTSDEGRAKLENLFGKLKIAYTESTITTELDDHVETIPYTVLGVDEHSVVIRDDSPPDPDMAVLEMSTFSKIHFDGDDSYWVSTEIGGITEYFKRVAHTIP